MKYTLVEHTKDGNIIIDGLLILRDPTRAEAGALIEGRIQELRRSGEAASESAALRIALRDCPLHAKIWSAT